MPQLWPFSGEHEKINHRILGYHNSWNPCFDVIYLMDSFKTHVHTRDVDIIWYEMPSSSAEKRSIVSVDMMPSIKLAEKTWKNVTNTWVAWGNGYQNPKICYQVGPFTEGARPSGIVSETVGPNGDKPNKGPQAQPGHWWTPHVAPTKRTPGSL